MLVGKINDDVKSEEIVFPCLMKNRNTGSVLLFTKINAGVLVVNGNSEFDIGYVYFDGLDIYDPGMWTPVKSITIETTGE